MYRYTIQWKAYPMDRSGVKRPHPGVITFDSERLVYQDLHNEVQQRVRAEHPELSSTPILIHLVSRNLIRLPVLSAVEGEAA
jgi:hypothetical protein